MTACCVNFETMLSPHKVNKLLATQRRCLPKPHLKGSCVAKGWAGLAVLAVGPNPASAGRLVLGAEVKGGLRPFFFITVKPSARQGFDSRRSLCGIASTFLSILSESYHSEEGTKGKSVF